MKLPQLSLLITVAIFATTINAAPKRALIEEFTNISQYLAATQQFSGTAILSVNGEPVAHFAEGKFNDEGNPVSMETPFNIGSIGKLITFAVVSQQIEKGRFTLDSTIESIWPDSELENAEQITIRHLLSHTSGYGNYFGSDDYSLDLKSVNDFIELIRKEGTDFSPPGSDMVYSNKAFWILAKLVESVDAKQRDWNTIVNEDVAQVLDINFYHFQPDSDVAARPNAYYQNIIGELSPVSANEDPRPGPDGGLYMTAKDLQKFHQGLLSGKLVSTKLLQESTQPIAHFETLGCDVGLVWELCKADHIDTLIKGGTTTGGGAIVGSWKMGNERLSLVMLSNYHNAPMMTFAGIVKELSNNQPFLAPEEHPTQWLLRQVKTGNLSQVVDNPDLWFKQKAPLRSPLTLVLFSMHIAAEGYLKEAQQLLTMQLEANPESIITQKVLQRISKKIQESDANRS